MSIVLDEFLYLGSLGDACTPELLNKLQITHLVNLSVTRVIPDPSLELLHLPLHDSLDENITVYFQQANQFIETCRRQPDGRCLVFCKHGRSRSAASTFTCRSIRSTLINPHESDISSRLWTAWIIICVSVYLRSIVLVVIAYLIAQHGHSLSSAYVFLSKCRPSISPNRNYLNQLHQYSSQSTNPLHCPSFYSSK